MNLFIHNLKVAWRNLMKYKLQTLISVLSIAVGIVTLSFTHSILSNFSLPPIAEEPYYERTYQVNLTPISGDESINLTSEIISALKNNGGPSAAEKIGFNSSYGWSYTIPTEFHLVDSTIRKGPVRGHECDPAYFEISALRSAITGKKIKPLKLGEAIVSEDYAKILFQDHNPIGAIQTLTGSNLSIPVTIVDVFRSLPLNDKSMDNQMMYFYTGSQVFSESGFTIVLKESYDKNQLKEELDRRLAPFNAKTHLRKISDNQDYKAVSSVKSIAYLVGCLILIAALIGFIRMQMQLIWMRRRELSLRVVNGASRHQLTLQMMLEITWGILMAVTISIIIGVILRETLTEKLSVYFSVSGLKIGKLWSFTLSAGAVILVICACLVHYFILKISGTKESLATNMRKSRNHIFRNTMLAIQISICFVFVCGSYIIIQGGRRVLKSEIIPVKDRLFKECLYIETSFGHQHDLLFGEIQQMPELDRIISFSHGWYPIAEARQAEMSDIMQRHDYIKTYCTLDTAFLSLMDLDVEWMDNGTDHSECLILQNDLFDDLKETGAIDNYVLTLKGCGDNGANLTLPIAGTFRRLPYETERRPMIAISPLFDSLLFSRIVVPKSGKGKTLSIKVNEAAERLESEIIDKGIYNYRENFGLSVEIIETAMTGGVILGCVSLLICIMGIFSTITLDTRGRSKEVAVRKVNGAKSRDIYIMFGKIYVWLILAALIISVPLCILFNTMVKTVLTDLDPGMHLSPLGPIIFGSLTVIILIFAIVFWQIHRVMRTDPAKIIAKE